MSKWPEKPISRLGRIVKGKTPSKAEPEHWDGDGRRDLPRVFCVPALSRGFKWAA